MNKNKFCEYGCGQRVSKPNNKFIHGHNRVSTIKSEEICENKRNRILDFKIIY